MNYGVSESVLEECSGDGVSEWVTKCASERRFCACDRDCPCVSRHRHFKSRIMRNSRQNAASSTDSGTIPAPIKHVAKT